MSRLVVLCSCLIALYGCDVTVESDPSDAPTAVDTRSIPHDAIHAGFAHAEEGCPHKARLSEAHHDQAKAHGDCAGDCGGDCAGDCGGDRKSDCAGDCGGDYESDCAGDCGAGCDRDEPES